MYDPARKSVPLAPRAASGLEVRQHFRDSASGRLKRTDEGK